MPHQSDRRQYARHRVSLSCTVDGVKTQRTLHVTDLSAGGCFIATRRPVAVGSEVTIRARLAGVELPLIGRVVRVEQGRGFGIEFGNLSSDTRYLLEEFLMRAPTPRAAAS